LRMLLRIRQAERCLAGGRRDGLIGGPVHLGVGQEAVAVGVAAELRKTDRVFGTHRSHAHVLSMGSSLHRLFAEILGKDTGLSRGMGGSMHLWDQPNGFYGSVPIVSGTVPLAVGAALAAKMQSGGDVGVAYLGDGAMEEGVVHESLNLAKMLKAPAIFVVENNLFASHMHISLRQPKESTARFAAANDIPYEIVDGNDVVKVRTAAARLISQARAGQGPGFLEAVTYRWYGHVDWREDIDVGVKRSAVDAGAWRKRDPIARLVTGLQAQGLFDEQRLAAMEAEIAVEVAEAWKQAQADAYPPLSALISRVFVSSGAIQ
jgi:TPP-dependent pyruvate/acetoin dehydrogenase alpha subunit